MEIVRFTVFSSKVLICYFTNSVFTLFFADPDTDPDLDTDPSLTKCQKINNDIFIFTNCFNLICQLISDLNKKKLFLQKFAIL